MKSSSRPLSSLSTRHRYPGAYVLFAAAIVTLIALLCRAASLGGSALSRLAFISGCLGISVWIAWTVGQAWLYPRRLALAERLWSADHPVREILGVLSAARLARGETGYRLRLLASCARLAEKDRAGAWQESFRAHLFRLPIWKRIPILLHARLEHRFSPRAAATWAARLYRFAPEMAPLGYRLASRGLTTGIPDLEKRAWETLLAILPAAQDDPVLLESIMMNALQRIRSAHTDAIQLGHQEWSPLAPYLFEGSLRLLLCRHGEPRVAWDRVSPALYLLQQSRPREVILLAQNLPLMWRPARLCEAEVMALRQTGDLQGAQTAIRAALTEHPSSFRLWMERFHAAMAAAETGIALESLEMAERLLPAQPEALRAEQQSEWHLRRAEFAQWIERAPDHAWTHLEALSEPVREGNELLVLQVQGALARYETAFEGSRRLLIRHPQNVDLLLLHAECMAGLEEWESLRSFLERLAEDAWKHPTFWHLKGLALGHLGDPQGAREHLEVAAHMAPRDLRLLLDAGRASLDLGDHTRAEYHWRRALRMDRKCEEALIHLADTRHARQDPEGARRLLRECLLHHPNSEGAQSFLAKLETN